MFSEDFKRILDEANKIAVDVSGADLSAILLVDTKNSQKLILRSSFDNKGEVERLIGRSIVLGEGLEGISAKTRKPILSGNLKKDSRFVGLYEGVCSKCAVPILIEEEGSKLVGVISLDSSSLEFFDTSHIQLLSGLAALVASSIQRSELIKLELESALKKYEGAEGLAMIGLFYGEDAHLTLNKLGASRHFAQKLRASVPLANKEAHGYINFIIETTESAIDSLNQVRQFVSFPEATSFDLRTQLDMLISRSNLVPPTIKIVKEYKAESHVIVGYEKQIQQVFRVLIFNAIEAMGGEGILTIRSQSTQNIDQLAAIVVEVGDTRPGISLSEQQNLFQLRSERSRKGFSMGLSWAKLFLTMCGGGISVKSNYEEGTVFFVTVPFVTNPVDSRDALESPVNNSN